MNRVVDILDKWHTEIVDKNRFLSKVKYYSVKRFIIKIMANILIPLLYRITKNERLNVDHGKTAGRLIVSLTTFPDRINKIWIVIECLIRQSHKPDMILLWLSKKQFPSLSSLPKELLAQVKRGLTIRLVDEDFKSHKKYYYALHEFPEDYLITVDDDMFYPTSLIRKLIQFNKIYPDSICCHRASIIATENSRLLPYEKWTELQSFKGPGFNVFQTSGGGTIYPPHSLHQEILNKEVFLNLCLLADDIWLNCMGQMNNTTVVKTDYYSTCLSIIYLKKNQTLTTININENGNDRQLTAVREYYINKLNIDPFAKAFN